MADITWLEAVAPPAAIGLLLSLAVEQLLLPRPALRYRPLAAWAMHIGLWLIVFGLELALFRRPFNAAANVLALQVFVVMVNNAKFHSLREPFVFQDFEYFVDALRHPRLYLPFFGLWRAVAAIVAVTGAVYGGLMLEAPLWPRFWDSGTLLACAAVLLAGAAIIGMGSRFPPRVTFDPVRDIEHLGQLACFWRYHEEERKPIDIGRLPNPFDKLPKAADGPLADIIAIQSESFFDARRLFAGVRGDLLNEFDRIRSDALAAGQLEVPAWGANTVRTEFAFLSGLGADALGVHRFNPYRKLARLGLPNLVSELKQMGYRTICLHPYPASFYYRDTVLPLLGFDEFIDLRGFGDAERFGPYVSDLAVAKKIKTLGIGTGQPLFVFVITMENHGPLHWEKVAAGDEERLYTVPPPAGWDDLTIYLRHLANADAMIGSLRTYLEASPREALLCFFGDHVPILPKIYEGVGDAGVACTDFFVWKNRPCPGIAGSDKMQVERLAALILQLCAHRSTGAA